MKLGCSSILICCDVVGRNEVPKEPGVQKSRVEVHLVLGSKIRVARIFGEQNPRKHVLPPALSKYLQGDIQSLRFFSASDV